MSDEKRVLVIDDEPMPRELLKSLLEAQGYAVSVAEDGEKGLEMIHADPPRLVLLDLAMTPLSGWGVINRLRIQAAPPPVIAMSALGDEEPAELTAISPFVHAYLPKPFRADLVAAACARVLALSEPGGAEPHPDEERRAAPRRDLVLAATLSSSSAQLAGELLDITTSGAQLRVGAELPTGETLRLQFEVPGGQGPFRIDVKCQWNEAGKAGLEFVGLAEADKARLAKLLGVPA